tara:strand:+ start:423 stop:746 length:324 start_codon:yes stop_codon:yes gene_type:complete
MFLPSSIARAFNLRERSRHLDTTITTTATKARKRTTTAPPRAYGKELGGGEGVSRGVGEGEGAADLQHTNVIRRTAKFCRKRDIFSWRKLDHSSDSFCNASMLAGTL